MFDKNVQSAKRTYRRENQEYLLNLNTTNPQEFWKRIGQIGVATERQKSIPMKVVKDGVVYNDKAVVINERGSQYSALYNFQTNNTVPSLDYNTRPSDVPLIDTGR